MSDIPIADFQKNSTERVQISLTQYGGHDLVSAWIWYQKSNGEYAPGRRGLNLRLEQLDDLLDGLARAREKAADLGLLPTDGRGA